MQLLWQGLRVSLEMLPFQKHYNHWLFHPCILPIDPGESIRDLEKLLKALDLLSYLPLFVEEDIDLQIFLTLSDQDFRSLGIT